MKGQAYIEAFKNNLKELVNKIKRMNALPVLQTPVPVKEELLNQEAASSLWKRLLGTPQLLQDKSS